MTLDQAAQNDRKETAPEMLKCSNATLELACKRTRLSSGNESDILVLKCKDGCDDPYAVSVTVIHTATSDRGFAPVFGEIIDSKRNENQSVLEAQAFAAQKREALENFENKSSHESRLLDMAMAMSKLRKLFRGENSLSEDPNNVYALWRALDHAKGNNGAYQAYTQHLPAVEQLFSDPVVQSVKFPEGYPESEKSADRSMIERAKLDLPIFIRQLRERALLQKDYDNAIENLNSLSDIPSTCTTAPNFNIRGDFEQRSKDAADFVNNAMTQLTVLNTDVSGNVVRSWKAPLPVTSPELAAKACQPEQEPKSEFSILSARPIPPGTENSDVNSDPHLATGTFELVNNETARVILFLVKETPDGDIHIPIKQNGQDRLITLNRPKMDNEELSPEALLIVLKHGTNLTSMRNDVPRMINLGISKASTNSPIMSLKVENGRLINRLGKEVAVVVVD